MDDSLLDFRLVEELGIFLGPREDAHKEGEIVRRVVRAHPAKGGEEGGRKGSRQLDFDELTSV